MQKSAIIGIDPGLNRTGWCVVNCNKGSNCIIATGCVRTSSSESIVARIYSIHCSLNTVIAQYAPSTAAIEKTFVNNNAKSSLDVGQLRGALLLTLSINGLSIAEYTATTIKKAITGNGHANKEQVQQMLPYLCKILCEPKYHDEYDAIAIALCHNAHNKIVEYSY